MNRFLYTTQLQVRKAWNSAKPEWLRGNSSPTQTDTRCAFVDFVDHLQKSGYISEALASRVTL